MTVTSVVRPLPGPGLVARSGDLMLVCAEGTSATRAEVEQLLGLVSEVAATGGDGAVLVRRVAALLAADVDGNFPDCAACGPVADGRLAVLVYGTATARVVGGDGTVTLSAADAVASVNRLVSAPITSVRLELPGAGPASQFARLDGGVVSAAGFVAGEEAPGGAAAVIAVPVPSAPVDASPSWSPPVPAPSVPAQPSWSPPVDAITEFVPAGSAEAQALRDELVPSWAGPSVVDAPVVDAVPVADAGPTAPTLPSREPLATEELRSGDARPTVLGLACPQGHLNDPSASVCATCGAALGGHPPALREGPRPPLGVITLDDGSAYLLDIGYVLGREPQHDPEVVAGGARPLKVSDPDGVVSRRHLRIALVGWDIQVIDLGSANGTFIQYPEDPQLRRLDAHHAVVVRPGTQVTMGRRWFRIDPVPPEAR